MADIIESNPTVWDQFTMRRGSDSPVQGRLPYSPEAWAALTTDQRDANRQAWFDAWQANTDQIRADAAAAALLPPQVPAQITSAQARRAIVSAGLKDQVEAAVASADQATQDLWYTAEHIERDNATLSALATGLWGDRAQPMLDQLFLAAQGL